MCVLGMMDLYFAKMSRGEGGVSRETKQYMRRWLSKMYCRTLGSELDSAGAG